MVGLHELDVPEMKADIERVIGRPAQGDVTVRNLVDVYYDEVGLEALAAQVKRPFKGLKVAAYYGCLLTRPPKVTLADDPEYPTHMDDVLKVLGCAPVEWSGKTDCCGASLALCEQSVVDRPRRTRSSRTPSPAAPTPSSAPARSARSISTRARRASAPRIPPGRACPILFLSQMVGRAIGADPGDAGPQEAHGQRRQGDGLAAPAKSEQTVEEGAAARQRRRPFFAKR